MAAESTDAVLLKHLPSLYHVGAAGTLTDGQLLDRFLVGSSEVAEAAFTALLDRHGPMVLRVCRHVLGNMDDTHDAFQATFLVLVRHAGSLRKRECLASWLYGVAQRVALRARVDLARRRTHERRSTEMAADSFACASSFEGWPELHEEIARLPEKYRAPIILCYFEGLTTELAAQKLGCPLGTVLSRLARARDRLRTQLTRRGMAL
ncbi:MAG TPA: RNA polymerase sigma factor, partial [Isosphaeraceae bacterium]|nr:RNA polymerase sigma factor [Isosphaeraceae bacterium]